MGPAEWDMLKRLERKIDRVQATLWGVAEAVAALAANDEALAGAARALRARTETLRAAVDAAAGPAAPRAAASPLEREEMPPTTNPTVDALVQQVEATDTVIDSAVNLIDGFGGLIDAAVQKALAGGATAEQLAPVTDAVAAIKGRTDQLSAAVAANTPQQPQPAQATHPAAKKS